MNIKATEYLNLEKFENHISNMELVPLIHYQNYIINKLKINKGFEHLTEHILIKSAHEKMLNTILLSKCELKPN